jgi:hypothetical protein
MPWAHDEPWHTRTPPRGWHVDHNRIEDFAPSQIELEFSVKEIKVTRIWIDESLRLT